ncbi:MAG: RnfABCDGE type electron transport complex subunit G [Oscillospiraceae bacterium]|jgi:electron transport complex protein RnfG|nr:RnfABCDGE type electron transport complex subunit G [Oscillospiraceae bacterium]
MDKKKSGLFKPVIVLGLISLITAGALGCVNSVTQKPIAELTEHSRDNAMREVLPADSYVETSVSGVYSAVVGGESVGYVVETAPNGFGGAINLVTGIDVDKITVTGVAIISMTETANLGTNADKPEWRAQFAGLSQSAALSKDGGTIDALTGATITSRAIVDGVNGALRLVGEVS